MEKIEIDTILHTINDADTGQELVALGCATVHAQDFYSIVKSILTDSQLSLWAGTTARTFVLSKRKQEILRKHIASHNQK